jgi:O-acetyl-ADP-ribose deacetylase (regulator of RNase III)
MPIKFISLNELFVDTVKQLGYEGHVMKIEDYLPTPARKTYYVSPANSLCFMDGGIDLALSRIVFPGIEPQVKAAVRNLNIQNVLGRHYLPIGSSIIMDQTASASLVVAPTMLLPQPVTHTNNAYYATMAVLYNILIHRKEDLEHVDILFTSLCCGYGKMTEAESVRQIVRGIAEYRKYTPERVSGNAIIIREANLAEQPKYYQNTEWFAIDPVDIVVA